MCVAHWYLRQKMRCMGGKEGTARAAKTHVLVDTRGTAFCEWQQPQPGCQPFTLHHTSFNHHSFAYLLLWTFRKVHRDLERARESLVLATDLHVTFLVTPIREDLRVDWDT
jgi:hypothetical protein